MNDFNPISLSGRKILITGASSGIGRAAAIYCSKLGADVVLCGRSQTRLKETAVLTGKKNCITISSDFLTETDFEQIFKTAISDGEKLDGMIYSAGVSGTVPLRALSIDRMNADMRINYMSFIEMCRIYSKRKYSKGGSIVGISSSAATRAGKGQLSYSASKAAMDTAVQVMALELIPKGIRVNTVQPGLVNTEMVKESQKQGVELDKLELPPLGIAEADDVAALCAFLLSDMSRMITGRKIPIDGGR
jgi:NAD(P)-dependent dehydrogenase (short-subunit alcohol dehydrogenase family)